MQLYNGIVRELGFQKVYFCILQQNVRGKILLILNCNWFYELKWYLKDNKHSSNGFNHC